MSKFDLIFQQIMKKIAHHMKKLLAFVLFLIRIHDIHVVIDTIKLQTHEVAIMWIWTSTFQDQNIVKVSTCHYKL
jgi:hypothetical protein